MHLKRVILRDYVRVGSKNTQQINRADFLRLEMVDGWAHVHHETGVCMISPSAIIQVDLEVPSAPEVVTDVVLTPPPNLRKRHHPFGS
jgi:hypothetical protein